LNANKGVRAASGGRIFSALMVFCFDYSAFSTCVFSAFVKRTRADVFAREFSFDETLFVYFVCFSFRNIRND
jgi:hypothetical protein